VQLDSALCDQVSSFHQDIEITDINQVKKYLEPHRLFGGGLAESYMQEGNQTRREGRRPAEGGHTPAPPASSSMTS